VNVNGALGVGTNSFAAEDRVVGDEAERIQILRASRAASLPEETKQTNQTNQLTETQRAARAEVAGQYYSVPDVLAALAALSGKNSVSRKTLERLEARGEGPPRTVLPGRFVVYRKDSFHEWLQTFEASRHARRNGRTAPKTKGR
jgi:hypothetical protein